MARRLCGLALMVLVSACAGHRQPVLWQPTQWPASDYRVTWPAADDTVELWVAIEAGADGLGLVVLNPQGVKMLTARLRSGQLEQQQNPLRPAGLNAAALLEAWQLAFGPTAIAADYGADCAFQLQADSARVLRCGAETRAIVRYRNDAVGVQVGNAATQYWRALDTAYPPGGAR